MKTRPSPSIAARPRQSSTIHARLRALTFCASAGLAAWLAVGAEAREARTPAWDKIAAGREAGKPVLAVIGLRPQKITIYDAEGPILQAPVSTGRRTYETPAGVFTVLQKNRDHVSNLYEDAEMPFMQRITWSGIALHAGPLPGPRASHGCIRLPYRFAERLFDLTSVGTRVVIAPNNVDAIKMTLTRSWSASSETAPWRPLPTAWNEPEKQRRRLSKRPRLLLGARK